MIAVSEDSASAATALGPENVAGSLRANAQTGELALADLQQRAVEPLARDVQPGGRQRHAVEPYAALHKGSAGVRARAAEGVGDQRRQVHQPALVGHDGDLLD